MKILLVTLLIILFSSVIIFDNVQAEKALGTSKTKINSSNVCGDKLCDEKFSIKEKILSYILQLDFGENDIPPSLMKYFDGSNSSTVFQQSRFMVGGLTQQSIPGSVMENLPQYGTPVIESINFTTKGVNVQWSIPKSQSGDPSGGYDIIVNHRDTNKEYRTYSMHSTIPLDEFRENNTNQIEIQARNPGAENPYTTIKSEAISFNLSQMEFEIISPKE